MLEEKYSWFLRVSPTDHCHSFCNPIAHSLKFNCRARNQDRDRSIMDRRKIITKDRQLMSTVCRVPCTACTACTACTVCTGAHSFEIGKAATILLGISVRWQLICSQTLLSLHHPVRCRSNGDGLAHKKDPGPGGGPSLALLKGSSNRASSSHPVLTGSNERTIGIVEEVPSRAEL